MTFLTRQNGEMVDLFAQAIIAVEGVTLSLSQPFVWRSGISSPIYIDARRLISEPALRRQLKESAVQMIQKMHQAISEQEAIGIAAVATGGLPWGTLLADALDVPLIYVRSSKKTYGREQAIEGEIDPKRRYIIVEDVISTGGSAIKAATALHDAGGEVREVFALYTYELPQARAAFLRAGLTLRTLGTFHTLIETMLQEKMITSETHQALLDWHQILTEAPC